MTSAALPFWDHVSDLRNTLLKCFCTIILGVLCSFIFYQDILSILTNPLNKVYSNPSLQYQEVRKERIYNQSPHSILHTLPPNAEVVALSPEIHKISERTFQIPSKAYVEINTFSSNDLIVLGPLDGILACFKICFWVGLIASSPIWILFCLQFAIPALHPHEKRLMLPFLLIAFLFLLIGFLFAFFITIPTANHYLAAFNSEIAKNLWTLSNYLDYSVSLFLANAFAFEMCALLLFLVHCRFFSIEALISKRRHVIVAAFIIGALLTPPDILTQLMLAVPLIILYELTIFYSRIRSAWL